MSDQLKNLLSDIVFENELSSSSLHNILKACNELQNFKNKDTSSINQIISNLNSNINVQQNHQLLNTVIQQCTEDLLVSHTITWMSLCIKSNDNLSASIGALDYTNLNLLVSKTTHSNDVKKQFIASVLPKFMLKLNSIPSNQLVCTEKLKCLESVLRFYNGPCFSQFKTVEKFLLNCIEQHHSSSSLLTHIGLCYTLLSQLGGGGHQTSLYKDNWTNALVKQVACTHKVLDQMFEDVPEIQTVPVPISIRTLDVTIPFLSYYPNTENTSKLHASAHLLRAFKVLSTLIRTHLGASFPAPKTINVEAVLSVVARVLSITPLTLSNLDVTSGHAILLSLLPEVHAHAHSILNTLILIAGRNLIPHSLYICKLTTHTLKWTNSPEGDRHALERPYRELRCAAYKTLHSWLTLAGYASNIELVAEELIDYLLADIVYEKQGVTLTTVMKKTRKRHKTKVGLESVDNNKSMQQRPLPVNGGTKYYQSGESLCVEAHKILVDVLGCAGSLLKPDLIQNIQISVAGLLLSLSTGCRDVYPYSTCAASRLALYSTLEACLLYSNPRSPDLAHYAIVFYRAGQTDSDVEIRKLCQRGIEILEKIQHPKSDSLNFVLENLEEEKLKLLGPYVGKVAAGSLVGHQMNGVASDDDSEEEMSEPVTKKGKQTATGPSGKGKQEQTSGNKQHGKQEGSRDANSSKQKKRKRNQLEENDTDEDSDNETESVRESVESNKKKKIKTQKDTGKNLKKTGKDLLDGVSKNRSGKKKQDKRISVKDSTMSKALTRITSLDGFSGSDSSLSDDMSDNDSFEDSDGSENNVAMMLMNAMMGGNNSDFSFDDEDEEDDDGEDDDSNSFEDDESDSEMETESSEDDVENPGVIITEIVDEEQEEEELSETVTTTTINEEDNEETNKKDGRKKTEKSKIDSSSAKTNNKGKEIVKTNSGAATKVAKTKQQDLKTNNSEGSNSSSKIDSSCTSSTKPTKGTAGEAVTDGRNEDKKKQLGKADSDGDGLGKKKNKDRKTVNDENIVDCIDLGESDDDSNEGNDQNESGTGNAFANKSSGKKGTEDGNQRIIDGNKGAVGANKGKTTVSSRIESEEIILSSDNSQDSVMPLQKIGGVEVVTQGINEEEAEESEEEEEVEDCLKLFSVE